jgi:hypothetical protein
MISDNPKQREKIRNLLMLRRPGRQYHEALAGNGKP